jgi:hypothetical protein
MATVEIEFGSTELLATARNQATGGRWREGGREGGRERLLSSELEDEAERRANVC